MRVDGAHQHQASGATSIARPDYTAMRYDFDPVQRKEAEQRATALTSWTIASDSYISDDAVRRFRASGFGRYVKTGDVLTSDETGVSLLPLTAAFVGLTDAESLIGQLTGALHLPLGSAARLQAGSLAAVVVGENETKPIQSIAFDVVGQPVKLVGQVVISVEAYRSLNAEAQSGIRSVLVSAVSEASDAALLTALSGGTLVGTATPAALLAAISNGAPRKPFIVGGYDMLLTLDAGTIRDLQALGVGVLASGAATGQLFAVDAAGLLVEDGGISVQVARDASMTINGTLTNLWQANLACLRAERLVRLTVRAGASAYTGGGSPA